MRSHWLAWAAWSPLAAAALDIGLLCTTCTSEELVLAVQTGKLEKAWRNSSAGLFSSCVQASNNDAVSIEPTTLFPTRVLGRMEYAQAYDVQQKTLDEVLAAREAQAGLLGVLLFVEHDAVITISRRAGVANHLLASEKLLSQMGVALADTDRGGDITYHGPGQLVAYPIIDLNALNLGLHDYMRLLEESVIRTAQDFGVTAQRDASATGVWVQHDPQQPAAKLCACGVRVRRWISMHGLAINITTNLRHFDLIVPCGLHGRPVTSLHALLGEACPSFEQVQQQLAVRLRELLMEARAAAVVKRAAAAG